MPTFIQVTANGPYLEYSYNDYAPSVGFGENLAACNVQLRPKANITQLCIGERDYLDGNGTPQASIPIIKVIEDGRESFAIGNDGTFTTVEEGLACAPMIYVIETVGGNATNTTQAVYDEIKTLLAT